MAKSKKSRNEILRLRYQLYRSLGYSSAEARLLRKRSLDVSELKTKTVDKKIAIVKNKDYYKIAKPKRKERKKLVEFQKIIKRIQSKEERDLKKTINIQKKYDKYLDDIKDAPEYAKKTTLTDWGYVSRSNVPMNDPNYKIAMEYKDRTARMAHFIKKDMHLKSDDQAYYVLWYMYTYGESYEAAKEAMVIDKNFEQYIKSKIKTKKRGKRK